MEMKGNPSGMRPWADISEPLAEAILDLLPLVDYIRFASVCKRWQSIWKEHRPRHPMHLPFPWFVSQCLRGDNNYITNKEEGFLESCSPLEKKHLRLPLPSCMRRSCDIYCFASCRGWLLMASHLPLGLFLAPTDFTLTATEPLLFNPVTRATIPLPRLFINPKHDNRGALSAPPTDPECAVLFADGNGSAFLHRLKDGGGSGWMRVGPKIHYWGCSVTACGGKFYCHYNSPGGGMLGVIDPLLPRPTMRSPLWELGMCPPGAQLCCMVDNDGDACVVQALKLDRCTIKGFRVFRADLSNMKWVRVETLGDRAIFVDGPMPFLGKIFPHLYRAFSFIATDAGLKKNAIYWSQYTNHGLCCWRAFDLDSESWVDGTEVSYTNLEDGRRHQPWHNNCWFVPTLDWIDTMQAGH